MTSTSTSYYNGEPATDHREEATRQEAEARLFPYSFLNMMGKGLISASFAELQIQYSTFKNTLQQLAQKIGEVEQEAEEHKLVFAVTLSLWIRKQMLSNLVDLVATVNAILTPGPFLAILLPFFILQMPADICPAVLSQASY
jgi:hypothetical protein